MSEYGTQLIEKQRARFLYGLGERQFRNLLSEAQRRSGVTGDNLLSLLERRLDNVVYRMGLAKSRAQARQIVNHGHLEVNGRAVDIPSARVTPGDVIRISDRALTQTYFTELRRSGEVIRHRPPDWIRLNAVDFEATVLTAPGPEHAEAVIEPQAIVEFYSR